MNARFFRLVFNRTLGMFVPAWEGARARTGSKRLRSCMTVAGAVAMVLGMGAAGADPLPAHTLPVPVIPIAPNANIAVSGAATAAINASTLTVNQSTSRAVIEWQSFNVGSGSTVDFQHMQGPSSATLNRVIGNEMAIIDGALRAQGQVYIINANGILFGKDANINVGALVASALNISNETFLNGLTSLVAKDEATRPGAAFSWEGSAEKYRNTMVRVDDGALIRTTNGGRVILLAPRVENQGRIETPEGQTILAAGAKVYLTAPLDTALRGFLVEVDPFTGNDANGQPVNIGGTVVNQKGTRYEERLDSGQVIERVYQIVAKRGNVTLAGLDVRQEGRILATSSIDQNGSVIIQARDTWVRNDRRDVSGSEPVFIPTANRTGSVVLAAGSEISVLPETAAARARPGDLGVRAETDILPLTANQRSITDDQRFNPSRIDVSGKSIQVGAGAQLLAPGGKVSFLAQAESGRLEAPFLLLGTPDNQGVRVYVDSGAIVDVSGERDVSVSVSRNVIEVDLRGGELKDAPLQRDGVLRGKKVFLDLRQDAAITDAAPFRSQVQRNVGEKSATGGSIVLQSEGDVVVRENSRLDVSGGSIRYASGEVGTTYLVGADGKVYDFMSAPKDIVYRDVVSVSNRVEKGYTEGKDAGSIQLWGTRVVAAGTISGAAIQGEFQRADGDLPKGGLLKIGDASSGVGQVYSSVLLTNSRPTLPSDFSVDSEAPDTIAIWAGNFGRTGFTRLDVNTVGSFTVPSGVSIDLGVAGTLMAKPSTATIGGTVRAASGAIDIAAGGDVRLSGGARLSTAGLWTNDRSQGAGAGLTAPVATKGGTVRLSAGNLTLDSGSTVDVSSGAWLGADGKTRYGVAGSISLATGEARDNASQATPNQLVLEGTLLGYGIGTGAATAGGGTLEIRTSRISVGATAAPRPGEWRIAGNWFDQGGFSVFDLTGIDAVTIESGARVGPAPLGRVLLPISASFASGTELASMTGLTESIPARRAPVTLTFATDRSDSGFGALRIDAGSVVDAGLSGAVTLDAQNLLAVSGSVFARGGSIDLALPQATVGDQFDATRMIWLGDTAHLSTAGAVRVAPGTVPGPQGDVLAGGTISIDAGNGFLISQAQSVLDVSGASAPLFVLVAQGRGTGFVNTVVTSNAGSISLAAREGMLLDGKLQGAAGGAGARAGSLSLAFDRENRLFDPASDPDLQARLLAARRIVVDELPSGLAAGFDAGEAIGVDLIGFSRVARSTWDAGAFDAVAIASENEIEFARSMTIRADRAISVEAPNVIATAGASIQLDAAYVNLGSPRRDRQAASFRQVATVGDDGRLGVSAIQIDLTGNVSLLGIGKTSLVATEDVRLRGVAASVVVDGANTIELRGALQSAGDVTVSARQVYASTLSDYTFDLAAFGGGTLRFERTGSDAPVLSAASALRARARVIEQFGVLKAPLGTIDLQATESLRLGAADTLPGTKGSITSVAAEGQTIPFGQTTLSGREYVYAIAGSERTIRSIPEKSIRIDAPSVRLDAAATIDLSGGGDLLAWEFVPGPGGSTDVLNAATSPNLYAILPSMNSTFGPSDAQSEAGSTSLRPGDRINVTQSIPGLAAGTYTLLPARYGLLPGAFLVTVDTSVRDVVPRNQSLGSDGVWRVAGRLGSVGLDGLALSSRTVALDITPGSWARERSEYIETTASAFFANSGNRLPQDAGRLAILAQSELSLLSSVVATAVGAARGGEVGIGAQRLAVVGNGAALPEGFVSVDYRALNALGAETLLLGGVRGVGASGAIDVVAKEVEVNIGNLAPGLAADDARPLAAPTLEFAASDRLVVRAGSSLSSTGGRIVPPNAVSLTGDGAYLRVSGGGQPTLSRIATSRATGQLTVEPGALLKAGSIIADATLDTRIDGQLDFSAASADLGGALAIGASRVSLGDAPDGVDGVVLSQAKLAALANVRSIRLKSYSTVDVYGDVDLGSTGLLALEIDAAGFAGHDNAGATAKLSAGRIEIGNQDGLVFADALRPGASLGSGLFEMSAIDIVLSGRSESNRFQIAGFAATDMRASATFLASDTSRLFVDGDLGLTAGAITAASSANTQIVATGDLVTAGVTGAVVPAGGGFGAGMVLSGANVSHGGRIVLGSGDLELRADAGNLTLTPDSLIDVTGVQKRFADKWVAAPGGVVRLNSVQGNVVVAPDSLVDVSAAGNADAGRIITTARSGTVDILGKLSGAGGTDDNARQGSFEADAGTLADLSALITSLGDGGFHELVDLRVRTGNVSVAQADVLKAHTVRIATDAGSVEVLGSIDASGSKGGNVELFARNSGVDGSGRITLGATGRILASATANLDGAYGTEGEGGRVVLGVTGGTAEQLAAARVILLAGGRIDVSVPDGSAGKAGEVILRVPRVSVSGGSPVVDVGLTSDATGAIAGALASDTIVGADRVVVEGVEVVRYGDAGVRIDAAVISTWRDQTRAFMGGAEAIAQRLGRTNDASFRVRPGLEIESAGTIALDASWDLRGRSDGVTFDWRYGSEPGEPGALTLRAGGDLNINQSLSDGFSNALTSGRLQQAGEGWSYRLVAGADRNAANPLAVVADGSSGSSGNLTVAAGRLVRTSTGDIEIATARDFVLAANTATVYTAGVADAPENHALSGAPDRQFTGVAGLVLEYPFDGGDVRVKAGANIAGAGGDQWVNDWLFRLGALDADGTFNGNAPAGNMRRPTWWPSFSRFKHGIGALGGGDIVIEAGGSISNLGVSSATNGRLPGDQNERPDLANLKVQGGGDVSVRAGVNVDSSFFHAGRGDISIDAGGGLGSSRTLNDSSQSPVYSVVSLGEGSLSATANGDLKLESVLNATLAPQSQANGTTNDRRTFFTTYRSNSAADLLSLSGDVVLANSPAKMFTAFAMQSLASSETASLALYPATVRASALSGDVLVQGAMTLAPAARGQLELLAGKSMTANGTLNVSALDMRYLDERFDTATGKYDNGAYALPSPADPDSNFFLRVQPLTSAGYSGRNAHGAALTHANDLEPVRIVALTGNVAGPDGVVFLQSPKRFLIEAGQDVTGAWIGAQNLRASDRSAIRAGRDIRFDVNGAGDLLTSSNAAVEIGGPGSLELRANRNIDLGPSKGIISRGNFNNPGLPEGGSELVVMAGTPAPDYAALLYRFSDPAAQLVPKEIADGYNTALLQFMRTNTGNPALTLGEARKGYATLGAAQQEPFVASIAATLDANEPALRTAFFDGVRESGRAAVSSGDRADYQAAYDIIATLFPTSPKSKAEAESARAALSLFRSQIKTEQGGGIDLLVPGGSVNVGVTDAGASAKSAAELGIVTARGGAIRSVVTRNFDVNTSRVFTLQGGDILLWSSYGNIDAGKGAKTASATPPPQIIIRGDQIILDSSNSISGSGIGVLLGKEGIEADDVDLFAPTGAVDAGDAGIRVAGNLNIGAERVIGADNIRVGGVSTGVPALQTGGVTVAVPNVGNPAADAAKAAEKMGDQAASDAAKNTMALAPSFLTVEVVGLGEDDYELKRKR